jgi:hypothetical protein
LIVLPPSRWNKLTSGWFSLSTLVFVKTYFGLMTSSGEAQTYHPIVGGLSYLSPTRQPLRVVFDLGASATGLQDGKKAAQTSQEDASFLEMIDQYTGFLTLSAFAPGSIVILIASEAERSELMAMVGQLETEEQRGKVKVALRGEW